MESQSSGDTEILDVTNESGIRDKEAPVVQAELKTDDLDELRGSLVQDDGSLSSAVSEEKDENNARELGPGT